MDTSNYNRSALQTRIMRRVYAIYILRKLLSPFALKMYVVAAFVWRSSAYFSVGNVYENALQMGGASGLYSFFTSAFANTETFVQLGIVAMSILGLWIIVDLVRSVSQDHAVQTAH